MDYYPPGRTPEELARRFREFADRECTGRTALYGRLSQATADDPQLLALAAHARLGQPVPNLLLSAVHYLLLTQPGESLAAHYPDLCEGAIATDDPFPLFRAFALAHAAEIEALLRERLVQTAHARRCACLLPAFGVLWHERGCRPLALIEIGASAGINLLWDRYRYRYSDGRTLGDGAAPLELTCELRGDRAAPLPAKMAAVAWRVGLDLNPIDVRDPDAARWLQALIWPDEAGRAALLRQAMRVVQESPPRMIAGDALETLPAAFSEAPRDATLCVYHSFTVNQFSRAMRARLATLYADEAQVRDFAVIGLEAVDYGAPRLDLTLFARGGSTSRRAMARCDPHGAWLEWQDEPIA